jgi:DNA-directed RNA polymerase specialized sigma24 family protein
VHGAQQCQDVAFAVGLRRHSSAEIARTLHIVEGTVKAHVSSTLDKVGEPGSRLFEGQLSVEEPSRVR